MNRAATPEITLNSTEFSISRSTVDGGSFVEVSVGEPDIPPSKTYYEKLKECILRPRCKKICGIMCYMILAIGFVGGLFAFVYGVVSSNTYTSPDKQCSGYHGIEPGGGPNGKTYINCYNKPIECEQHGCSTIQCLENNNGVLICQPANFDTYYEPPMIVMITFGALLSCVSIALLITAAIHCCMLGRYASIFEIMQKRSYLNFFN